MGVGRLPRSLDPTAAFLKQVFRSYYSKYGNKVAKEINFIRDREFGFSHFERGGLARHSCFRDESELSRYLVRVGPRDVYVSVAYYALPCETTSMEAKGWAGADLAFDVDADHVLKNGASTSYGVCTRCVTATKELGTCPSCGNALNEVSLVTEAGLTAAGEETAGLVDTLKSDFGFTGDELSVFFSGHRGFHVLVASKRIRDLSPRERVEIVDYLTMRGFSAKWGGNRMMREIEKRRVKLARPINDNVIETLAIKIDPVVTIDVHRLLRAPMTLHGKTGLTKIRIPDPLEFEGLGIASLLSDDEIVTIRVIKLPKVKINGVEYGPYADELVKLPLNVAVLFLCLGAAIVAG